MKIPSVKKFLTTVMDLDIVINEGYNMLTHFFQEELQVIAAAYIEF